MNQVHRNALEDILSIHSLSDIITEIILIEKAKAKGKIPGSVLFGWILLLEECLEKINNTKPVSNIKSNTNDLSSLTLDEIAVLIYKDWKKVNRIQKKFGVEKSVIKDVRSHIKNGNKNGGYHSYNVKYWESIILIYPSTSKKQRTNVICHEKRHCEDKILEHTSVYGTEAPAYLAGYLGKMLI